ncbi:hypothetical protein [Streptomyces sp. NPDC060035]|uniref:hypothetical protein n=1 Tax=Streptomyces sp. NPDC060035 TaxID=3347044 RepID=UPI0036779E81
MPIDGSVGSAVEGCIVEEVVHGRTRSNGPALDRHEIGSRQLVGGGGVQSAGESGGFAEKFSGSRSAGCLCGV